jgi:hypothetical protein
MAPVNGLFNGWWYWLPLIRTASAAATASARRQVFLVLFERV